MKIKSQRNWRRVRQRNENELTKYMCKFVEDCKNNDKSRWRSIYEQYEKIWVDYSNKINHTNKEITIYTDGFENCIINGYDLLTDHSDKKVSEIFYFFKKKTLINIIVRYLKNYYGKIFVHK